MEENKKNPIQSTFILYPLRGFVIALVPWLTHLFPLRHMRNLSEQADLLGIPHFVFYLFSLLILALIYNSFTLYFATYDREEREAFFLGGGETLSFFAERGRALKSLPFLLELISSLLFTAMLFFLGGFGDISYFTSLIPIQKGLSNLIGYSALSIFLFILLLDRRCEARKYWQQLSDRGDLGRLDSKWRMALRGLAITLLYPIATPVLPMILYFAINLITIILGLADMLTAVGFILTLAAVITIIILLRRLHFFRVTRRIEKSIAAAAESFGYKLRLYAKDERALHNCNGYLEKNEKRYYFKIMASPSRFTPLYFMEHGAYYLHKFGTKNHYRSYERHVAYTFDCPGQKSIILPKITNYIFAKEAGSVRRVYEGDDFWNYTIYNPKSFLGNLERDCIGRTNYER